MEDRIREEMESPLWNDWRWQMRNRVRTAEELSEYLPLTDEKIKEIEQASGRFRMAVTPYYLSLIDPDDPEDPLFKQCVISSKEMLPDPEGSLDPLDEVGSAATPHIIHRYPDRVLLLTTMECGMYCRHCTRKRIVGEEDRAVELEALDRELDYVRARPGIRDVLISGGDPLTLPTERLEAIIRMVRAIGHVEIIRIGTRVPCVLPMRIDDELLSMLKRYQPVWINVQFNHPKELSEDARKALRAIADAGIPLGNQSVLLKGINDDLSVMKELLLALVRERVRPYYLYQCDLTKGIAHFRTPVETGIGLVQALQGNISGFAVPRFVIDAPGGGGKVPIDPPYLRSLDGREAVFVNYQGKEYRYPQPGREEKDV